MNTKAVLRWQVVATPSLPEAVRRRFLGRYGNRINGEGELVLAADEHREQSRNLAACRERLRQMILAVLNAAAAADQDAAVARPRSSGGSSRSTARREKAAAAVSPGGLS